MNPKKHRATSGSPYEATVGFSRGVREGKPVSYTHLTLPTNREV